MVQGVFYLKFGIEMEESEVWQFVRVLNYVKFARRWRIIVLLPLWLYDFVLLIRRG
jgi:hypothetical protein